MNSLKLKSANVKIKNTTHLKQESPGFITRNESGRGIKQGLQDYLLLKNKKIKFNLINSVRTKFFKLQPSI